MELPWRFRISVIECIDYQSKMKQLILINNSHPSEMDRAMEGLTEWMGVERTIIEKSCHSDLLEEFQFAAQNGQVCIAVSADTLEKIPELSELVRAVFELGAQRALSILVYGLGGASSHTALLESLGCHCIQALHRIQSQSLCYRFSTTEKACLQQLAGLKFEVEAFSGCHVFELAQSVNDEVAPLLFVDDQPVFVRTTAGQGNIELYLWATNEIADVGGTVPQGTGLEGMYQWLLPAVIFLKTSFGPRCWHNPNLRARLIIDDPLLHRQYGFLRYDALLASMQRVPYGTSLAFIPWNYRRSQKRVAGLFLANKGRLSLCVHGCDHTNYEFDSDDEQRMTQIAALALRRMRMHHERSGVSHENIMVFPQGHFSSCALRALRTSGYVAAVNTSCYPSRERVNLTLGDLLRPAVCCFHGFPIFLRRKPGQIIDIAVDLFLGKAGFIVEHHEFVRDGYGKWEQFVARMNALDERLSWGSLAETITETCLQKLVGPDAIDIRLFTPIFKWTNPLEYPVQARLSKFEPNAKLIKDVRVNGQVCPFRLVEEYLYVDVVVKGKASIMVEVLDEESTPVLPLKPSLGHQIRVGSRRVMSEFRDNWLVRYPSLLEGAKGTARHLRLTSDSR